MKISLVILGCREDEHRRYPRGLSRAPAAGVRSVHLAGQASRAALDSAGTTAVR